MRVQSPQVLPKPGAYGCLPGDALPVRFSFTQFDKLKLPGRERLRWRMAFIRRTCGHVCGEFNGFLVGVGEPGPTVGNSSPGPVVMGCIKKVS